MNNNNITINAQEPRVDTNKKVRLVEKMVADPFYRMSGLHFARVDEPSLQKMGVDLMIIDGEKVQYVDEKFAVNTYNLGSYSFELYSENNVDCNGWFTSSNNITTHYVLMWITADKDGAITKIEMAKIAKSAIKDFAKKIGFDDETLAKFRAHWENPVYPFGPSLFRTANGRRYMHLSGGCRVVQSTQLRENPINLVIPKETLLQMADTIWVRSLEEED